MNAKFVSYRWWALATAVAALAVLIAINWQSVLLTIAIVTAERRPSLLSDAGWGRPASAKLFRDHFAPGTPEIDLTKWLDDNRFIVDQSTKHAIRTIRSMPCNEHVSVRWTTANTGILQSADALITEAGCL